MRRSACWPVATRTAAGRHRECPGALGGVLADLWSFRAADAAAGRVRWAQLTAGALMRSGAAPPPRWGHAAWLSGAGEMVLAGGTGASGKALTDGVWAVGVGCAGDETRTAARGTLSDGAAGAPPTRRECRWLLRPSAAYSRVRLVLSSLDLADASLDIYDATNFTDAAAPTAVTLQPAALGAPYLSSTGGLVLVLPVSHLTLTPTLALTLTPNPNSNPNPDPNPNQVLSVSQPAAAASADLNMPAAWRAAPYFTATYETACAPGASYDAALRRCQLCVPGTFRTAVLDRWVASHTKTPYWPAPSSASAVPFGGTSAPWPAVALNHDTLHLHLTLPSAGAPRARSARTAANTARRPARPARRLRAPRRSEPLHTRRVAASPATTPRPRPPRRAAAAAAAAAA